MPPIRLALVLALVHALPAGAANPPVSAVRAVLADYRDGWYTVPTAINNRGEIAGWAMNEIGETEAFLRASSGRYRKIVANGAPTDLNDRGVVVGFRYPCPDAECVPEGFVWSARGGARSLGSFVPLSLNRRGDMAGVCATEWQACVMRDGLVSVVAGPDSEALGINSKGAVVGVYGDNRAFVLTTDWAFHDIGRGVAADINDKGVIAGHRWTAFGQRGERALLTAWTRGRPRSPFREVSLGIAVNNRNWVISNAWDRNEQSYSFAWNVAAGTRVRLRGGPDEYVEVVDINDRNVIVGTSGVHAVTWRLRQR